MAVGRKHSKDQISLDVKDAGNMHPKVGMGTGAYPVDRILLG